MELKVERYRLLIIPETPQDEAMLEEVFGLKKAGDSVEMKRVNAMGLGCWAYAEIDKPNAPQQGRRSRTLPAVVGGLDSETKG